MLKRALILFLLITVMNCGQKAEDMIPNIQGYWEISEVKKNGSKLKEFNINTTIDYFEIIGDNEGFRKKLVPSLDGRFESSNHQSPFVLQLIDGDLKIVYSVEDEAYSETIIKATQEELIIKNDSGFVYVYKPYTSINLDL